MRRLGRGRRKKRPILRALVINLCLNELRIVPMHVFMIVPRRDDSYSNVFYNGIVLPVNTCQCNVTYDRVTRHGSSVRRTRTMHPLSIS